MTDEIKHLCAAIELGKQGYACFPCGADKTPTRPHGFKYASPNEIDLRQLWPLYPGPLAGVATGLASQIAVLDIDAKHPEAGEWWTSNRAHFSGGSIS
jgi:hypothetical protein